MTNHADYMLPHNPGADLARANLQLAACKLVEIALDDADAVQGLAQMIRAGAVVTVSIEIPGGDVAVELHRGLDRKRLLTVRTFGMPT